MTWKKNILRGSVFLLLFVFFTPVIISEKAEEVRKLSFSLISEGITLYKRGEYQEASDKLEKASHMALNSFLAYYYYGLSLYASRRYSEAVEPLKIALDLNPKHIQAHIALGDTYLKIGDYEEAYAEYYRTFEINKAYAPAYDGIGRYYESIGKQEEAIKNFEKAIELNKVYAEAYLHLGNLYLRLEKLGRAIELLSESVNTRPNFPEALNRLGVAYAKIKLYNRAVTTIKKAITLMPKDPFHYLALGEVFLDLRNLQQASSLFEKAIELDPLLIDAHTGLAKVLRLQNEYDASLFTLEKIKIMKQIDAEALEQIEALQKMFLFEKRFIEQISKKLNENSATREDIKKLSELYASKGNFLLASSILEKIPDLLEDKSLMQKLAYYLIQSNRFKEAHEILNRIVAQWEADAATFINRGICYSELGNDEKAVQSFLKALTIDPENRKALLYLANSFLRMGNLAEAENRYSQFIEKGGKGAEAERVKKILNILKNET